MCSVEKKDKLNELLDYVRGDYNVFYAIRTSESEVVHSAMIADLLNPRGHHQLGDMPLKKFCEILNKTEVVKNFEINPEGEFYIKCEKVITSARRMDIYIKDQDGRVVIIENKIGADDQPSQLYDYYQYGKEQVKNDIGKLHLFYLTLDGKPASCESKQSGDDNNKSLDDKEYKRLSYKDHILPWLNNILNTPRLYQGHVLFYLSLLQYRDNVEYLVNPDKLLDMIKALINDTEQYKNIKNYKKYKDLKDKDIIVKYLTKRLRDKIAKDLCNNNTVNFSVELEDVQFKINESTKIKIWTENFYFQFIGYKDQNIISKLDEICKGAWSCNDKHYYYWTLTEILPNNTLINTSIPEELTPNDLKFLLSDEKVYSPNFEQIIKTLTKYIDIVKRPK